jgi:hypothetical protein
MINNQFFDNLLETRSEIPSYIIRNRKGKKIKARLEIKPTNSNIALIRECFEKCVFNNIDIIIVKYGHYVDCMFINLKVVYYNPYRSIHNIRMLINNIDIIKKNEIPECIKISTITIKKINLLNAKIKRELIKVTEIMISSFLNFYSINAYQRLALYEPQDGIINIDINLLLNPSIKKNELFIDEL